jgi:hypothetical protein
MFVPGRDAPIKQPKRSGLPDGRNLSYLMDHIRCGFHAVPKGREDVITDGDPP